MLRWPWRRLSLTGSKLETENEDAITAYETYKPGQKDFTKPLKAIQESGVKSVLLPGDSADSANIINQAADMGLDVMFLGPTDWSSRRNSALSSAAVSARSTSHL